jgi:hypothetical protein
LGYFFRAWQGDNIPSMNIIKLLLISACYLVIAQNSSYAEELIKDQLIETAHYENGDVIPYMLTANESTKVRYVLIVMPGGVGYLDPELRDGKVWFKAAGNFLIRSRALFVDSESVVISTNSTGSPERMMAIIDDASKRYVNSKVFIIGTSRSTISTMRLAEKLDSKVTGFIHTASMGGISRFDTRKLISKQLIVHHKDDGCRTTPYGAAKSNQEDYGTTLITMEGGITQGDPCEAFGYHGFNGIEKETVNKIKSWIKAS